MAGCSYHCHFLGAAFATNVPNQKPLTQHPDNSGPLAQEFNHYVHNVLDEVVGDSLQASNGAAGIISNVWIMPNGFNIFCTKLSYSTMQRTKKYGNLEWVRPQNL